MDYIRPVFLNFYSVMTSPLITRHPLASKGVASPPIHVIRPVQGGLRLTSSRQKFTEAP